MIPEGEDTLQAVTRVNGCFVALLSDGRPQPGSASSSRDGGFLRELELPGLGTVTGFVGRPGNPETFFCFTGYTTPSTIYRYDVETGESRLFREPRVDFDPSRFETRQVFYRSRTAPGCRCSSPTARG